MPLRSAHQIDDDACRPQDHRKHSFGAEEGTSEGGQKLTGGKCGKTGSLLGIGRIGQAKAGAAPQNTGGFAAENRGGKQEQGNQKYDQKPQIPGTAAVADNPACARTPNRL